MKIPPYTPSLTNPFKEDFQDVVNYILQSNLESYDLSFCEAKIDDFQDEVLGLIDDLVLFPEQGVRDKSSGVRKKPIYRGRYSVRWVVDDTTRVVHLIGLKDNERPKELRYKHTIESGED
ncbi:MAG: hypothetical protein ACKOX6_12300 [Bdellovibrio sp.]